MNSSIDILEALFGGPARIAILRLLVRSAVPLTGRQVAELGGLSQPGASRALEHLAELGVVHRRRVGRATLHELERENVLVETMVLPVIEAESSLGDALRADLAEALSGAAVAVVLFGSVARGEAGPGSDIDVLAVVEDDSAAAAAGVAADEAGPRLFRRWGMPLSVVVTTRRSLAQESPAFLERVRVEGVAVSGTAEWERMRDGPQ
ncbi:MAG: hypothetical protein C0418_05275 [Coriobacteriaceae bacterium]|nr:hypothetical protein [Coriobacteriaceae bacterium]